MSTITLNNVKHITNHLWRVNFELPKFSKWVVSAFSKNMYIAEDGSTIGASANEIKPREIMVWNEETKVHTPTAVMAETVTLDDGTVISMAQIIEAGDKFGDKWLTEDQA